MKRQRTIEAGHLRKYLIVVDDSPEVESALYYAASRVQRASGVVVMLYVIEPQEYTHWMGVRERQIEEETATAKALFRMYRRKLNQAGFESVPSEELIRDGAKAEQIVAAIDVDHDIGILVLGASTDAKGPGPLVASLAVGKQAGAFPIPITVVPGNLALDDIKSLA